jgi:hypothetical protein
VFSSHCPNLMCTWVLFHAIIAFHYPPLAPSIFISKCIYIQY